MLFFFKRYGAHRDLHSFPTRRSSDLTPARRPSLPAESLLHTAHAHSVPFYDRSEEHTSELQSHSDLVFRLLLEKKKVVNYCCLVIFPCLNVCVYKRCRLFSC